MSVQAWRVIEKTVTSGSGPYELLGADKTFERFRERVADGGKVVVTMINPGRDEAEEFLATLTYGTPDTLTRVKTITSSDSDAAISFGPGSKIVMLCVPSYATAALDKFKLPVRAAVLVNYTLSSVTAGSTFDGLTLAAGDRVLLGGQTTASQNGIYVVQSSGSPVRATDFWAGDTVAGSMIPVLAASYAGQLFVCTSAAGSDIVNTSSLVFSGSGLLPVADSSAIVKGSVDATKKLRFEVDGFTTGTTRVVTFPDADINLSASGSGTFQPLDAELSAVAGLTSAANKGIHFTGSGTASTHDLTSAGRDLVGAADVAAQRTALGLGDAALKNVDVTGGVASKAYVDTAVTGLLEFKGSIDASANPNFPAAEKGDAYVITAAGKVGGASGRSVDVGDVVVASADNAGGTEASVGTSWAAMEHNLQGALLAANNLSDVTSASTARTNLGLGTAAVQNEAYFALAGHTHSSLASLAVSDLTAGRIVLASTSGELVDSSTVLVDVSNGAISLCTTNTSGQLNVKSRSTTVPTVTYVAVASQTAAVQRLLASDETTLLFETTSGGVVRCVGGSASTPGFSFVGDTDTGVYSDAANQIFVCTGGVLRLTINSTGMTLATGSLKARSDPRTSFATDTSTLTHSVATWEGSGVTAQAQSLTIANPTGTPVDLQPAMMRLKDNGTSRSITWGSEFRSMGATLPTATTAGKWMYMHFRYNSTDTKWDLMALVIQA